MRIVRSHAGGPELFVVFVIGFAELAKLQQAESFGTAAIVRKCRLAGTARDPHQISQWMEAGVRPVLLLVLLLLVLEDPCKIEDEDEDDMTRRWMTG